MLNLKLTDLECTDVRILRLGEFTRYFSETEVILKIYANVGYIIIRGEGKLERARWEQDALYFLVPLPPRTAAGCPTTRVFVAVSEARRYLAANIPYIICSRQANVKDFFRKHLVL
jgi:hypothetical protein